MKKLLLIPCLLFPAFSFAQSQQVSCPAQTPKYTVNIIEPPLVYNTSLRSKQIAQMMESKPDANMYTLGLFHPQWKIRSQGIVSTISNSYSRCEYVPEIKFEIEFHSTIYLSKESQLYQCTYNRVLKHEQTHYQLEKNSFNFLVQQITRLIKIKFDKTPVSYNNNINLGNYINNQSELLNNELATYLKEITQPYHNRMDTKENYQAEQNLCSLQENILISDAIKK